MPDEDVVRNHSEDADACVSNRCWAKRTNLMKSSVEVKFSLIQAALVLFQQGENKWVLVEDCRKLEYGGLPMTTVKRLLRA